MLSINHIEREEIIIIVVVCKFTLDTLFCGHFMLGNISVAWKRLVTQSKTCFAGEKGVSTRKTNKINLSYNGLRSSEYRFNCPLKGLYEKPEKYIENP